MLKIGLEITQGISNPDGTTNLNIKLIDPSKKQLEAASDNEKVVAQKFKNIFDKKLIELLEKED